MFKPLIDQFCQNYANENYSGIVYLFALGLLYIDIFVQLLIIIIYALYLSVDYSKQSINSAKSMPNITVKLPFKNCYKK